MKPLPQHTSRHSKQDLKGTPYTVEMTCRPSQRQTRMKGPVCVSVADGTPPMCLSDWIHSSQEAEGHRIHQCHVLNSVYISMLNTNLHKFTPALEGYHHIHKSETTQGHVSPFPHVCQCSWYISLECTTWNALVETRCGFVVFLFFDFSSG